MVEPISGFNEYKLNIAMNQRWREKRYSYKNSARRDCGFLYVLEGNITYTFGDQRIVLGSGDIIFLPKGSYYEAEFDVESGAVSNYLINFDIAGEDGITGLTQPLLYYRDEMNILSRAFGDVVRSYNAEGCSLLTRSLFYLMLHSLASAAHSEADNKADADMVKGAELLAERADLSVKDIADKLHISQSSFQKRFKDAFGMPPVKYRTVKKLEKAKLFLDTTDMPIKEIAEELGFYDLSYFYKVFEEHCSLSPKKYRDSSKYYL